MWIALLILAVLWAILWIPVRLHLCYDEKFTITVRYLFLKYRYQSGMKPVAEKPKPQKEAPPKQETGKKKKKKSALPLPLKDLLSMGMDVMRSARPPVARFLRSIVVERLILQIAVGGEDVAAAAQGCGRWAGVVYPAYAAAHNIITLRPAKISITPNYLENRTWVEVDTTIRIRPARVLGMAFTLLGVLLYRILPFLIKHKQKKNAPAADASGIQGNQKG